MILEKNCLENGNITGRNINVDALKGLLIIFVVIGHTQRGFTHDIIFLFHMPLFFMLSGSLLNREKLIRPAYLKTRSIALLIPYVTYLLLDWIFVRRDYSISSIVHVIWGGRALSGTYWYITCFIAALFLFSFLLRRFSDRICKCLIVLGGYSSNRIPHIGANRNIIVTRYSVEC